MLPLIASAWVRELWAPDEPRYAQVAREIFETGEFLVMHLCGQLYPDKPPLLYWLSGLFGWLSDWSELWMRVPSLLATLGTAWLVGRFAARWWGRRAAAWAPALFLGTVMVTEIGGRLQIDPLLSFLCVAALYLFADAGPGAGGREGRVLAGGLCVGVAALAKGPVAFVNVGLVLALWVWIGPPRSVNRAPWWAWVTATVLAVAPVLVWASLASAAEPRLVQELFFGQHLGRVAQADRHPGPPWKHIVKMPLLLLPWTTLVAAGLLEAWRSRHSGRAGDAGARGLVLSGLWLAALVVFYSAIPPKRDLYLLSAYPAAALLAAGALTRRLDQGTIRTWVSFPAPLLLAVLGSGLCAAGLLTDLIPGLAWRGPVVGLPLIAGSVIAIAALRRRRIATWALAQIVCWGLFALALAVALYPPINGLKSARGLALELAARPEKPSVIPCIGLQPEGYRFYGDGAVPAVRGSDLVADLGREGGEFLALVLTTEWERLLPEQRALFRVLMARQVGGKRMVVIGAAQDPPSPPQPPPG